jgi:hypothetical protein
MIPNDPVRLADARVWAWVLQSIMSRHAGWALLGLAWALHALQSHSWKPAGMNTRIRIESLTRLSRVRLLALAGNPFIPRDLPWLGDARGWA